VARYIITGAPGAGKTSLLEALQQLQFPCYGEVSRQLIIDLTAKGSRCLPWIDLPCFAELALSRMMADYRSAPKEGPVFFDRGIPDIIAYLSAAGFPVTDKYRAALRRYPYDTTVFLLPSWEDIYVQDPQRWQSFEEARLIDQHIRDRYRSSGYRLVTLPKSTVTERVAFIQDALHLQGGKTRQYDQKDQRI
jgi:predicted ATPase